MWSDAAGTKGLGAVSIDSYPQQNLQPHPGSTFSITLPPRLSRTQEHINTKEMGPVEQALLHWGKIWKGKRLICQVDNRAVFHGLEKRTIRGTTMNVLRQCLLLPTEYDLETEARWFPTRNNALADAPPRFDYNRIANLAPELIYPTCNNQDHGFLTYNKRDSHQ